MRYSLYYFGLAFVLAIGFLGIHIHDAKVSNAEETVYTVENAWLKAEINTNDGAYIQQLTRNSFPFISKQPNLDQLLTLKLYKDHPFKTEEQIELPNLRRIRQLKDIDPDIPSIHWLSETDDEISVSRVFAMNATEAILHVTTTIENIGTKTMEFFPTESVSLDVSNDIGKATPDLYLYLPANAGGSVKQPSGEIEADNGLMFMPDYNVFVASYQQIPERAAWRASHPWFALYNHQKRESLGYEIQFNDTKHIQPVDESLIFQSDVITGEDGTTPEDAYFMMQNVLGKVNLPPNESFTYVMQYSLTNTITPIVGIHNGVAFVQRFQVYQHPVGFYVAGAMGLPLEGKYGLVYFDKSGEKIRRSHNLYGFNIDNQQRPHMLESKFNIPSMFSTVDGGFGMTEDNKNAVEIMHDKVNRIQLVLLDPETLEPIKVIDESIAPWPTYQ